MTLPSRERCPRLLPVGGALVGLLAGLPVLMLTLGCQPAPAERPTATANATKAREVWNAYYIGPTKVGYERLSIRPVQREGRSLVALDGQAHLTATRFQEQTTTEIRCRETDTADGQLIDCETTIQVGPLPQTITGTVVGDQLQLRLLSAGKATNATLPWSEQCGGFFAVEQSLRRTPMQPGQRRQVQGLLPGTSQLGRADLEAKQLEQVTLLGKTARLLRIESRIQVDAEQPLHETLWVDSQGEILRRKSDALGMETIRVTEAQALEPGSPGTFDWGTSLSVPVKRPLAHPHETKRVQYRVHLPNADPASLFPAGPSQQVERIDAHTALVTVYALRPGTPAEREAIPDAPPTEADRQPNNILQSDDPEIVALAQRVAGGERDPWKVAVALERCIPTIITQNGYTEAFATASEVLRTHKGDCTEHAVLLAALARARGIPARVAMGLVYMPGKQAFAYHLWTEVWIDKHWIAVDGTLAGGGIGAAHLKLAQSSLEGTAAYSTFLPVAQVAGKLQLEIVDVQ